MITVLGLKVFIKESLVEVLGRDFVNCENGSIDPLKPQKSWRTAWRTLTRGIHCPACGEFQSAEAVCRNEAQYKRTFLVVAGDLGKGMPAKNPFPLLQCIKH